MRLLALLGLLVAGGEAAAGCSCHHGSAGDILVLALPFVLALLSHVRRPRRAPARPLEED